MSLPPEILDLIVDHLHNELAALKACCVVSKSWVPRARKHLFARVKFDDSESHTETWKKVFPDPFNSPAHHTRSLSVQGIPVRIAAADADVDGWTRAFRNVVDLRLSYMDQTSFLPFYGLSPVVRSLHLTYAPLEAFDIICSFPLLEDLTLVGLFPTNYADSGWDTPLTSPKLTGSLDLRTFGRARYVIPRLLDLPGGLHFSQINAAFFFEDVELVTDLVTRCSNTLESLSLFPSLLSAFH